MSTHKILVPFDFTEEANCALDHAIAIAKTEKSEIYLNHIIDKKTIAKLKSEKKSEKDLENSLQEVVNKNSSAGVKIDFILREGDIFSTISEIGEEIGAQLIIFGTHGVKGMQHILGAFALKLVVSAKCPVIIVQRRLARKYGYQKIIFPIDELEYSKQKAEPVAAFAKQFNSEIFIFPKKSTDDHFQAYINGNTRYAEAVFKQHGIQYQVENNTKTSSFSKLVIEYAAKNDADIISIITQQSGDKDIGDIFLGNEDVKIINNEPEIPILCFNAFTYLQMSGIVGVSSS